MDTYLAKVPSQSAEQTNTAAAEQVAGGQNAQDTKLFSKLRKIVTKQSTAVQSASVQQKAGVADYTAGAGAKAETPADKVKDLFSKFTNGEITVNDLETGLLGVSKTEREKPGATVADAEAIAHEVGSQAYILKKAEEDKIKKTEAFDKVDSEIKNIKKDLDGMALGGGK